MMEQRKDYRKLGLAIMISLFLHLVIGFSLAAFGGAFTPTLAMEEKPVELTIVDLPATPPPLAPKNVPFLDTSASRESKEKPKNETFESNANSIAGSKLAPTGDLPLPEQDGKERKSINLETHDYSLPTDGSKPQPEAQSNAEQMPAQKPKVEKAPLGTPLPIPTPEAAQLAMLKKAAPSPIEEPDELEATPAPTAEVTPPPVKQRPKTEVASSSFQAQKEQTRIRGSLTSRGPSSVNAVGTPLGRYQKSVYDAIGSRWYYYIDKRKDLISIGSTVISAEVDPEGHIQNLRVRSNDANEAFANICLQSFQEAHIPPIPPDLIPTLPDGKLQVDINFTFYPN